MDRVPTAMATPRRMTPGEAVNMALNLLWIVAVGVLAYLAAVSLSIIARLELSLPFGTILLAAAVYLAGHGARILRLALLIGGWRVGWREIASFHLMTAGVTLATPMKLGELYRVGELSRLAGGWLRAIVIVWWERLFDAVVLLLILGAALASGEGANAFRSLAFLLAAFVALTAIVVFVLPDNLRRLSVLIIRRYRDERTVPVLAVLDRIRRSILEAPRMVRNKLPTLFALTFLVWGANLGAMAIALPSLRQSLAEASAAQAAFLSAISEGETLPRALAQPDAELAVTAVIQVPLALIGLAAALSYGWLLFRRGAFAGLWTARTSKP